MTEWLKLKPDQRIALISGVEYTTGILPQAIEKDWWVTLTLQALFEGKYGVHMVFKGGTSLSKCWKLIQRFSEDIDIALAPEAFGMEYHKKSSKSHVDKLKRAGCSFTSNELKEDLQGKLNALGVPDNMITVAADPVAIERPDTDPQTLHVKYRSLFEADPYIVDDVKIEVSVRSLQAPYSKVAIQSILSEAIRSDVYKEEPLHIDTVEAKKTFLEKIFLLHEEFGKPDIGKIRAERMSRHLYDLSSMMDTDTESHALADHALYDGLIAHRKAYQRISWVEYETLGHKTVNFIPPANVMDLYRKDYETMQEQMIYGETPHFDKIIERLTNLQEKFRNRSNQSNEDTNSTGESTII